MHQPSAEANKAVRWTTNRHSNGEIHESWKTRQQTRRYATRDQPTWNNCKYPRPPQTKNDSALSQSAGDTTSLTLLSRESCDISYRTPSPRRSLTPRSASLSARSSFSRQSDVKSVSSRNSGSSNSLTLGDVVRTENTDFARNPNESGRDILKRKAMEFVPVHVPSYSHDSVVTPLNSSRAESDGQYSSLKRFRVSSASSNHRCQDVSIGLRQISNMLQLSAQGPNEKKPTHSQRSAAALSSVAKITSENLLKIRRRSEPVLPTSAVYSSKSCTSTPAPGEGRLEQRRRSSLSAPATRGAGSVSFSLSRVNSRLQVRKLPKVMNACPYADQEWRPPTLQKFSTKPPWAPKQQTTRYFPRFANLQDINCRNPYVVPGSILYKTPVSCD